MARKKNPPDNVADQTVRILQKIHKEIGGMRTEITGMRTEQHQTNLRLDKLTARFDHFLDFSGDKYRDHETRIQALERRIRPRRAG